MSNRTNGATVRQFEQEFAQYIGAKYAIAMCNGTATLHTALVALGVQPGDRVAVPPLTMASTTLAVLHAGAVPEFTDVDPEEWTMAYGGMESAWQMPVSLYGTDVTPRGPVRGAINDAAQTLNEHDGEFAFTSYSFQASKILSTGEGGCLVTDDEGLANKARMFSRLGYPTGKVEGLKHPNAARHAIIGYNYRMSDAQAEIGRRELAKADTLLERRRYAAACYCQAIQGCDWITPQYVPDGWPHSYWTMAIALRSADMWEPFVAAIEQAGGERPYAAWRITYQEPAFRQMAPDGTCPVAEDLQPRLVQLQTNHTSTAESERAAEKLHTAIGVLDGTAVAS